MSTGRPFPANAPECVKREPGAKPSTGQTRLSARRSGHVGSTKTIVCPNDFHGSTPTLGLFGPIEEIVVKQKFLEYCVGKRLSYIKRGGSSLNRVAFCKEFKQIWLHWRAKRWKT